MLKHSGNIASIIVFLMIFCAYTSAKAELVAMGEGETKYAPTAESVRPSEKDKATPQDDEDKQTQVAAVSDMEPLPRGEIIPPSFRAGSDRDKMSKQDDPGSLTGHSSFPRTSIGFNLGNSYLSDGVTAIDIIGIYLGGSFEVIPYKLSIMADLSMNIVTGDKSQFTFGHFGLGAQYTFYNKKPVVLAVGANFRLLNQALDSVYSADIFYMRPYVTAGISVWRLTFSPYLGIPVYIDTNNDNDPPKKVFPARWPNYSLDENPFGLDYGIPIALRVVNGFHITFEPSATTWLYPDVENYVYLTPGIMYGSGMFSAGIGVRIRVYPEDTNNSITSDGMGGSGDRRWQIVANAGVSF